MNPTKVLYPAVAIASAFGFSSFSPAFSQTAPSATSQPRGTTTFICGESGNQPATLVQVNGKTLVSPLITWSSTAFGDDFPPQRRCEIVSERLAKAVTENNGRLSNLRLASGIVNDQTVICYTNGIGQCTSSNLLFTLSPVNARNPRSVLARLLNFSRAGSGEAVPESGRVSSGSTELPIDESEVSSDANGSSISLEDAINRAIQPESGEIAPEQPMAPESPSGI
jgi:hypothetical protein